MDFLLGVLSALLLFAAHATGWRWGREDLIVDARRYRWLRQQPIDAAMEGAGFKRSLKTVPSMRWLCITAHEERTEEWQRKPK